jgi:DNA primase
MFNQEILGDIRDRLTISAFIGERIPLKKAGRNFKGLCPFHQEKTPSFMVSDEKQIFHCFGCGEGGDVFKFIMKYEGLTFAEAVQQLAERAGVALPADAFKKDPAPDAENAKKKKWLYRLNQVVAEYYHESLKGKNGAPARNYLISRGILEENWTQHFLGYAEKRWDTLVRCLVEKKIPLELALELGLIKKRASVSEDASPEDKYFDFFRNRLMFPIVSSRGEVIGFSGRALEEDDDQVKYLNSPDSIIYHKSNSVYGLNVAQQAIRKEDRLIIVEGNIDLISLHQNGVKNVVAPLGTALTTGHLRLLSRYSKNMILVFDGDDAGFRAARRALPLFIEMNLVPRAAAMPAGEDPDSFIRKKGAPAFLDLVNNAPLLFEHIVDKMAVSAVNDTAGRIEVLKNMIPVLADVSDPIERGLYRGYLAKRLRVKEEVVDEALRGGLKKTSFKTSKDKSAETIPAKNLSDAKAERLLIETMIKVPDAAAKVFGHISAEDFADRWCRTVAQVLKEETAREGRVNVSRMLDNIADTDMAAELRTIAVEENDLDAEEAGRLIEDCIAAINRRRLARDIEDVNERIKEAEAEGDESKLFELLARKRDLAAAIAR